MIGYVTLGTNDLAKSANFYDAVLGVIGASRMMDMDNVISWGIDSPRPLLGAIKPFDGKPATPGNGTMVALAMDKRDQVDAVHNKAMELGAPDEGALGERGPTFYAGYFRDPDGNKLCVYCLG